MKRSIYIGILTVSFISFLAFNNCSGVKFAATEEASFTKTVGPAVIPTEEDIDAILNNCEAAQTNGSLKTLSTEIKFDDTRVETGLSNICSATTEGNFVLNNIYNGKMVSRYEQSRKINLPSNAVVCDISLSNTLSSFKYDDSIFMTYNNFVIASNNRTSLLNRLDTETVRVPSLTNGLKLYKYDWLKLREHRFENVADDYCVGSEEGLGECSWPVSQKAGSIKVAWNKELLIALGLSAASNQQEFKFIVTGDNDPSSDCYHQELKFATTVKYYLK